MDLSLLLPVISLIFTVVSKLLLLYSTTDKASTLKMKSFSPFEDLGCFSGCLMSSAGIQKLFCGIYLAFKCSFDEFVGEKFFISNVDVLSMVMYRRRSYETIVKIRPITGSRRLKSKP